MSLATFTAAYITAALWSSTDDGGTPLDSNYSDSDLAPETLARINADCAKFYDANEPTWAGQYVFVSQYSDDELAGHDFWLTRNGHGAGFWDRDWIAPVGESLTAACKAFGECDLYVGDDGLLYLY